MIKIKKCPICHKKPKVFRNDKDQLFTIKCVICDFGIKSDDLSDAIQTWNKKISLKNKITI